MSSPFGGTGSVQQLPPIPQSGPASIPLGGFRDYGATGTAMPSNMTMPMPSGRPQCGGGGVQGDYDLPLHTVALFLVLAASIGGAGFPVMAKKFKNLKIPPKVFFFCKHFGTGVLIATAFVHLLPTAFTSLNDPCLPPLFTEKYPPLPGAIMMLSLFTLFSIELWLNNKMGGHSHSHGGPTGGNLTGAAHSHGPMHSHRRSLPPRPTTAETMWEDEKKIPSKEDALSEFSFFETQGGQSEMPAWFVAFYEQYIRQRDEMYAILARNIPRLPSYQEEKGVTTTTKEVSKLEDDDDLEANQPVDPLVLKKMSLNITLLEGGILFHSVFVGMTVSITVEGFVVLLIAILFHQTFEGLGLGSRIAAVPYPKGSIRPWVLVFAFGTTAPFGQALGLIARQSYDPNSAFALILVGTFNAISSGLLIYAALVDLLQEDFLSEEANRLLTMRDKIQAFSYVLLGAAGMATVGAFA